MVMGISTYRFWFQDCPREHTPRVRNFLTFVTRFGLVLLFLSPFGFLTSLAYLGMLLCMGVQPQLNMICRSDTKSYLHH
jgi:hypothetical protein